MAVSGTARACHKGRIREGFTLYGDDKPIPGCIIMSRKSILGAFIYLFPPLASTWTHAGYFLLREICAGSLYFYRLITNQHSQSFSLLLGPLSLINYSPSIDQSRLGCTPTQYPLFLLVSFSTSLRGLSAHYSPHSSPPRLLSINRARQNPSSSRWQPRRHGPLRRLLLRFQSGSSSLRQDGLLQPSNPPAGSSLDLQP